MTQLTWDAVGERRFETGVDHGVLYIPTDGVYDLGVAWNGLTTVTESPSGAEAQPQYADNIKYLNLMSAEDFGATIEAFTYPSEFEQCDGSASPTPGVTIGQQTRKPFGFSYRTLVGNDTEGTDHGYKLHLVYGALAAPSEKARTTVNDSPEAVTFSWAVTTTPVAVPGFKPSATLTIDSTEVDADALAALEAILYGTEGAEPRLPLPGEVFALFDSTITTVETVAPTQAGNVITIPAVAGVVYKIGNAIKTGVQPAITKDTVVKASPASGYTFSPTSDTDWTFQYS
jgi:hypothetical protein